MYNAVLESVMGDCFIRVTWKGDEETKGELLCLLNRLKTMDSQ